MNIFLVVEDFSYEGFEIDSIYSNRAAAKERQAKLKASVSWPVDIMTFELLDEAKKDE